MRQPLLLVFLFILLGSCSEKENSDDASKQPAKELSEEKSEKEQAKKPEENFSEMLKTSDSRRDFTIQDDDMVIGNKEAKVVVIEYFAMTCPHCHGFLKRTFPSIKAKYIDTNKIAYVFREFVGNKQDLYASSLARCDGSTESYINFMEVLLSKQNNWAFTRKFDEVLTNIAALGGVSPEQYSACIADDKLNKVLIENTKLPMKVKGFVGTPAFFINGKHFTKPYTFQELSSAIDKALKEAN